MKSVRIDFAATIVNSSDVFQEESCDVSHSHVHGTLVVHA